MLVRRVDRVPAWIPRLDARTLRRRIRWSAALLFALSAGLSYSVLSLAGRQPLLAEPGPELASGPAELAPPLAAVIPPVPRAEPEERPGVSQASTLRVITGRIPKGGTVFATLGDHGVAPAVVHTIAAAMRPLFHFTNAHAGDFFALIQDSEGQLLSFEFQRGRRDIYRLERGRDGKLVAAHAQVPLERRVVQLAGIIEKSLFDAVLALGEGPDLVNEFADIFVWDFDFGRQTRPGDEFRLVYEKYYDREGFVRYGAILAAQYRAQDRDLVAVYFEEEDGYGDYYTPAGNSVRRTFLRAPLRYARISSRYSHSRLHPILKVRRPHHGIDYAAPLGTPIWAVADGKVVHKGWGGGFGRLIRVRHNNGYESYYGHLSRYARSLKVGDRVSQRQVIGYVGSSGLSSGPHLDYRLKVGGRFVDPMRVRFPKGDPVAVASRELFDEVKRSRLAKLNTTSPPLVLEAAM